MYSFANIADLMRRCGTVTGTVVLLPLLIAGLVRDRAISSGLADDLNDGSDAYKNFTFFLSAIAVIVQVVWVVLLVCALSWLLMQVVPYGGIPRE